MENTAPTPEIYLSNLPDDRRMAMMRLRDEIISNIPDGFMECMSYGMINYVVPHRLHPAGYHCNPKQPLPFISIASQKNHISVYHMGIYSDPALLDWFLKELSTVMTRKPDMGKGCIRFKKPEAIPFDVIGRLVARMTVDDWIRTYEAQLKR